MVKCHHEKMRHEHVKNAKNIFKAENPDLHRAAGGADCSKCHLMPFIETMN